MANNHILDFGAEGLRRSVKCCQEQGLYVVGVGENLHDAEKFCAWCLSEFRYVDSETQFKKVSGISNGSKQCTGETIMMAPAAGFYTTPGSGVNQVRLAYVLCKEDIQRALMIMEKAIEEYNSLQK